MKFKLHKPHKKDFYPGWFGFVMAQIIGLSFLMLGISFFLHKIEDWPVFLDIIFGLLFTGIWLIVFYISFMFNDNSVKEINNAR